MVPVPADRIRSGFRPYASLWLCLLAWAAFTGPVASRAQQQPTAQTAALLTGSVRGIVTDADGALIPGAQVTLAGLGVERTTVADNAGAFHFDNLAQGAFKLTVTTEGLAPVVTPGNLLAGEDLELPPVALRTATTSTDVEVYLSQEQVAEEQVKNQEQQRLFGVAPNYFVSYEWHAAPLTRKQKYRLAGRTVIDPMNILITAGFAGVQQWQDDYSGYHQGALGYSRRFGAAYADMAIGTTLGGAVLPSLFHQDPRYFYKGTGSKVSRALYALSTAVIQRGDNGRWQPGYSSMLGDMATGAISNLYYPASDRNGASLTIENGLLSIGFDGLGNLVQEFLFKHVSTGVKKP